MGVQLFTNGASSTLSGTLSQGGTTMTLATGTGAKFPSVTGSDFFLVTLFTKDVGGVEQNIEVVKVTARVGDTLTIVRDFENSTGQAGGFAYDGTATTVFVHLRWTAASAGGMLQKSGNLSGLADAAVARANLGLGTSALLNAPSSGNASLSEVVKGGDTRLSDARTPTAHNHAASGISDSTPTGRALVTATDAAAARAAISAGVAISGPTVVSANTTLQANSAYSYSAAGLTLSLPAAPANGDRVVVFNTGSAVNCIVGRNGKTIMGLAQDITLDMANRTFEFTYVLATGDWRVS